MNWEEIAAAHKDQTPLVWSPSPSSTAAASSFRPPHREIVTVYRSNPQDPQHPFPMGVSSSLINAKVWVVLVNTRRHQVDARIEDLRPATAQDLLELG